VTVLTQSRLKELLIYLPKQGLFVWRVSRGTVRAGSLAGTPHSEGYIQIQVDGDLYLAHRLAFLFMKGAMPIEVDHENHVRNDNRWVNLWAACRLTNMQNTSMRADNSSGKTGVSWDKRRRAWQIRIQIDGVETQLGYSDSLEEAIAIREAADLLSGFHANHGNAKP